MITFVDTETGGLDPLQHEVIELAWAPLEPCLECDKSGETSELALLGQEILVPCPSCLGSGDLAGEPKTLILPHDPSKIDPRAAEVNRYYERRLFETDKWCTIEELDQFFASMHGVTWAGCNPRFDETFLLLLAPFHEASWHYRLLDIESWAAGRLGLPCDPVPSTKTIYDEVVCRITEGSLDAELPPEPDHTAAGDVRATIGIYRSLRDG